MKERKDAQQAYINAMNKLKMPADIDLNKKIIVSGSSKVKMKSKAFAYAALAAMLIVCIAVGAIVLYNRDSNTTPKIGSSRDMTLEKDQSIPGGEITSVEQAVAEHQKCELLLNDEYIKLKANRDNISKEMADSFYERTQKLAERDKLCTDYISEYSSEKTLFVHAIKFDNGYIDIEFHLDSESWEQFDKLYEKGYGYYICNAKTGEKLLRCVTEYRASPKELGARAQGSKVDMSELAKLKGKLSSVLIGSDEMNERVTVLEEFEFFDKIFIGGDERAELKQLADKARNGKDEKKQSYPLDVKLVSERADAHGIVVKLTAKPNSEQGAELIRKYGKVDENSQCDIYPGGERKENPQEITVIGSDGYCYSFADQHHFVRSVSTEKGSEYIDYICYIPLRKTPPEDLSFDIYLSTTSSDITDKDIENGITKRTNVGKITVKYKRNVAEKVYIALSGKKIYLSDLYFTVHDYCENGSLTLKYSNGTQRTVNSSDLWLWELRKNKEDKDLFKQFISTTATDDDIRANFFKDEISTGDVTSVTYAGEEYKLNADTQYKTAQEASQAFEQAYNGQLEILKKYKNESGKLSKDTVTQMCEQYDEYLDTICKSAKTAAGKDVIVLARKTAGSELILYIWSDADLTFPARANLDEVCEICDNDKTLFSGKLNKVNNDLVTYKDTANYGRFYLVTVDCKGADMGQLKKAQQYYVKFYINNGTEYKAPFTLTTDQAELSVNDRNTLYAEMTKSVGYKAFTSQN